MSLEAVKQWAEEQGAFSRHREHCFRTSGKDSSASVECGFQGAIQALIRHISTLPPLPALKPGEVTAAESEAARLREALKNLEVAVAACITDCDGVVCIDPELEPAEQTELLSKWAAAVRTLNTPPRAAEKEGV